MKTIGKFTNNEVTIGPASLYTTLKKLLAADLAELSDADENKKVYKITNKGRDMLIKEIERKRQMIKSAEKFLN